MKPFFTTRKKTLLFFLVLIVSLESNSTETPAILREWAAYSGISDSTFKTPVLTENDFTYVATVEENTVSGADIVVIKYNNNGIASWKQPWTGAGLGRDQAADMVMDSLYLYICGTTFSSATNFDYVVIKMQKANGAIEWTQTFNGTANNYDIATAIAINDSSIYVTGVTSSLNSLLDYHTLKYNINGTLLWSVNFDYNNLLDIPFAISYSQEDSNIIVTGGSQSSIYDWDYQTNIYKYNGTTVDLGRVSGTSVGFDRATAVKTDSLGNIYITGVTRENNSNFDIKTVKLDKLGNLIWQRTFDNNGGNDIANDLVVNNVGEIYLVGTIEGNGSDYLVMRLDASNGGIVWQNTIDCGANDTARAICLDSHGNIVITGQAFNPENSNYDFLTLNFDRAGQELWRDYFDGPDHGDDNATNIASDNDGNIFVTGQTWVGNDYHSVTIKYKTDFFTQPPVVDTPSVAYLFYPNSGQLIDVNDSLITDSVHYYTLHHYPQLYFGYGMMNMVWSHVDEDTATTDTLQRVDVTFANSQNPTEAYPIDEDTSSYLNYFLGHCPNGITNVHGNASLLFTDVYPDIDVLYSSNNAGLKLLFIINPGASIPQEMGLAFAGDNGISVLNNWGLNIHATLGDYEFEKPHVYQIDTGGNRIALPWHLNWNIVQSGEAGFTGWGSYDGNEAIIIEIGSHKTSTNSGSFSNQPEWATYFSGNNSESGIGVTVDQDGNPYFIGNTNSSTFPTYLGLYMQPFNFFDIYIARFGKPGDYFSYPLPGIDNQIWTTFWGGDDNDEPTDISVRGNETSGSVYVVGRTSSSNFPSFDPGSSYLQGNAGNQEGFIIRIPTSDGGKSLSNNWSTYFGGQGFDNILTCKNDLLGNLYIAGATNSTPTDIAGSPSNECDVPNDNGFPLCNTEIPLATVSYTKHIGQDAFLAKINTSNQLVGCGYIGDDGSDQINCITNDSQSNIVLGGFTAGGVDFPLIQSTGSTPYFQNNFGGGSIDGFIIKLDNTGVIVWSTLFGGGGGEGMLAVECDLNDDIFFAGNTSSSTPAQFSGTGKFNCQVPQNGEFPICVLGNEFIQDPDNDLDADFGGGTNDGFIGKFSSDGQILWSTYLGSSGNDLISSLSLENENNIVRLCFSGNTNSDNLINVQGPQPWYLDCFCSPLISSPTIIGFLGHFETDASLTWLTYNEDPILNSTFIVSNNKINSIYCYGQQMYVTGETSIESLPSDYISFHSIGWPDPPYYEQHFSSNKSAFIYRIGIDRQVYNGPIGIREINDSKNELLVFPNPTMNELSIEIDNIHEKSVLTIMTTLGEIIKRYELNALEFSFPLKVELSDFPSGNYLTFLETKKERRIAKFIIEK